MKIVPGSADGVAPVVPIPKQRPQRVEPFRVVPVVVLKKGEIEGMAAIPPAAVKCGEQRDIIVTAPQAGEEPGIMAVAGAEPAERPEQVELVRVLSGITLREAENLVDGVGGRAFADIERPKNLGAGFVGDRVGRVIEDRPDLDI